VDDSAPFTGAVTVATAETTSFFREADVQCTQGRGGDGEWGKRVTVESQKHWTAAEIKKTKGLVKPSNE